MATYGKPASNHKFRNGLLKAAFFTVATWCTYQQLTPPTWKASVGTAAEHVVGKVGHVVGNVQLYEKAPAVQVQVQAPGQNK
jgi:hypothetical protein